MLKSTIHVLSFLSIVFGSAPIAFAQDTYRPMNTRVVCVDAFSYANVYDGVGGDVRDQLGNETEVRVLDYVFGPDDTRYFDVAYGEVINGQAPRGLMSVNDLRNFCDFEDRRARTLNQYRAPPNTCHLIGASRRTVQEVNDFALTNAPFFASMQAFRSENGWYAISLGLIRLDALEQIKQNREGVPEEAYCSDGANYIGVLEKLEDRFQLIDVPVFERLDSRFDAAADMRREADDTNNALLHKRACDLGDWIACARYARTIQDGKNEDPDAIVHADNYNLLGCMRGSHFGCNNAFNNRRTYIDHAYSPNRISSGARVHPLVTDELARVGCDGGVGASCRHLGDETWENEPSELAEFAMALHALHTACDIFDDPEGYSCSAFHRKLAGRRYMGDLQADPYAELTLAQINAESCQHDPNTDWASCNIAYRGYREFLESELGAEEIRRTARSFLVDGCEVGDRDACLAFARVAPQLPEFVSQEDILRAGRSAIVCNTESNFTNFRNAPTSDGSSVLGRLPNTLRVTILDNVINRAGYLYYHVELEGARDMVTLPRNGYVYRGTIAQTCDEKPDVSQIIRDTALALAQVNSDLTALDIYSINANFDGTQLLLANLPGLDDITPLASLNDLTILDLSRSSVVDLMPLANSLSLEILSLYYADVADVTPLADLTGLRILNLRGTRVADLSPLARLTNLELLYLPSSATDIDLTPLSELIDSGLRVE